jgi:hypothetical protein
MTRTYTLQYKVHVRHDKVVCSTLCSWRTHETRGLLRYRPSGPSCSCAWRVVAGPGERLEFLSIRFDFIYQIRSATVGASTLRNVESRTSIVITLKVNEARF